MFTLPVRCDGPYKGRVVGEDSGEPLAGVVVVASWSHMHPNVGGGTTHCLDAAEALTDAKGEFEISGRWAALFRPLGTMHIHIYKVGYQRVECMWRVINKAGSCYADKSVEFDDGRAIFPLKRVAKGRLMEDGDPPFITCGRKDGKPLFEYHKARREYRRARGLKP